MNINNIFDKQTSTLALCSDTVKEPAAVPVIVGCKNKPFYYRVFLNILHTYQLKLEFVSTQSSTVNTQAQLRKAIQCTNSSNNIFYNNKSMQQ